MMAVGESFFERHPAVVAHDLIGCHLTVERGGEVVGGRIVETEAYAGVEDSASHSARMTFARKIMSAETGRIYVYRSYGIHLCFNIVAHERGKGGAVLIRALQPTIGLDIMRKRRGAVSDSHLCRGPGNVGKALAVSLNDIGAQIASGAQFRLFEMMHTGAVWCGPRIGISKAVDAPWRFFDPDSSAISSHRRGAIVEPLQLGDIASWTAPVE